MKKLNRVWAIGGIAVALAFSATHVMAGRGTVLTSPARLQQEAANLRSILAVTNDDEWAIISQRLVTVIRLKGEADAAAVDEMLGSMAGGSGGDIRAVANIVGAQTDPNDAALTKAITDEAPLPELRSAMARVRNAHKAKLDQMARAQAALLEVVSVRQEAILLSKGLLE